MWHAEIKLLRTFHAIAYEGSLTKASVALNLTQPAISGHLKELEGQLGFKLFERSTRRVELTPRGEELLPYVSEILDRASALERRVNQMQLSMRNRFLLGAVMYTLDFPERAQLLDAFEQSDNPSQFSIENYLQVEQVPRLLNGTLDAGLLLGIAISDEEYAAAVRQADRTMVGNELVYPASLERIVLGSRQTQLLVPVESPLAEFSVISPAALAGQTVAMLGSGHGSAIIDPIEKLLNQYGAIIRVPADTNSVAVNRFATLNRVPAVDLGWHHPLSGPSGGMVRRPLAGLELKTEFALVLGQKAPKPARNFFEFARQMFAPISAG